jgi:hypothetical protein
MPLITVVSQNVANSGLYTANGSSEPERWEGLMDTISQRRPGIVRLQEVGRWVSSTHRRSWA